MPLDQILFKMESSISRPTGGIFFNIRGETPSKPGAEDVREKIAFLSSVREKGIVRKSGTTIFGIGNWTKVNLFERRNVRRRYFVAKKWKPVFVVMMSVTLYTIFKGFSC
jgi:hypothetical protein